MVLPGIQALFGFQLIAVFNTRFDELAPSLRTIHLIALVAGAVSMSLVMTPAAYHRIAERGQLSSRFAELASWLIAAAMAPLALSIALDAFLVSVVIAGNLVVGALIGAFLAMLRCGSSGRPSTRVVCVDEAARSRPGGDFAAFIQSYERV